MKRILKMLPLGGVAAAAFVALLAALFLLMPGGGEDSAKASGGTGNPPTIFGIDVDPTGNSCVPPDEEASTDGSCTLGTIEQCIEVEFVDTGTKPGPIFNVDVFLDDIPNGKDLAGGDWFMHYDSAYLKVNRILPSPARCNAWLLGMKLGSGCADNGERPTVALPDTNGILNVSMVDGNGQLSAELPGVAGQDRGVLDRYELQVRAAGPALAQITFEPAPTYFASSSVGRYDPTQVWDGNYSPQYGLIAIDRACPSPNTAPTVAPPSCVPEPSTVGQSVTCTATFTDDGQGGGLSCTVNFGDGTTIAGTVGGNSTSGTCTAIHTYTAAATRTVTVTVSDGTLSGSNNSTHQVNAANTAPTVAPPSCVPEPSTVGQSVTCSATFTDDGLGGGPVTCSVNFGDGTTIAGTVGGNSTSGTCTAIHTYTAAATRTVTVSVSDGTLPGSKTASHLVTVTPPEELTIDIRPGSYPNTINLKSTSIVPVAILTTDAFDASNVNPASARFEGASPVRWVLSDVDHDGDLDLLLHFRTQDTSIVAGQVQACLTATTFGGMTLAGCDSIKVVPAKGAGGVHGGMLALGAPLGLLGIRLGRNALEKTRRRS